MDYLLVAPYLCLIVAFLLVLIVRKRQYPAARYFFWFIYSAFGFLLANYLELLLPVEI